MPRGERRSLIYSGTGGVYSIPPSDSCHFNLNRDLWLLQPQLLTYQASRTVVTMVSYSPLIEEERANQIVKTSYRSAGHPKSVESADKVDLLMCRRQPGIGMFPATICLM